MPLTRTATPWPGPAPSSPTDDETVHSPYVGQANLDCGCHCACTCKHLARTAFDVYWREKTEKLAEFKNASQFYARLWLQIRPDAKAEWESKRKEEEEANRKKYYPDYPRCTCGRDMRQQGENQPRTTSHNTTEESDTLLPPRSPLSGPSDCTPSDHALPAQRRTMALEGVPVAQATPPRTPEKRRGRADPYPRPSSVSSPPSMRMHASPSDTHSRYTAAPTPVSPQENPRPVYLVPMSPHTVNGRTDLVPAQLSPTRAGQVQSLSPYNVARHFGRHQALGMSPGTSPGLMHVDGSPTRTVNARKNRERERYIDLLL